MNFHEALKSYAQLRRKYEDGWLSPKQFAQRVYKLRFRDDHGVWWQVRPGDGGWFTWDDDSWVPAVPPGLEENPLVEQAQISQQLSEKIMKLSEEDPAKDWIPIEEDAPIHFEVSNEPSGENNTDDRVFVPSIPSFENPNDDSTQRATWYSGQYDTLNEEASDDPEDIVAQPEAVTGALDTHSLEHASVGNGPISTLHDEENVDETFPVDPLDAAPEGKGLSVESAGDGIEVQDSIADIPLWRVRIEIGARSGERFEVDKRLTIGREVHNDLQLLDPLVSRRHAVIRREGVLCYVEDLISSNGTYLNGEKVLQPTLLRAGDRIAVGSTEMQIELLE